MAYISIEQRPEYFEYLNKGLDANYEPTLSVIMTNLSNEGSILGVVVFSQFNNSNCEISVVSSSPRFLTRDFMDVFFHYAFITAKIKRINALVAVDNACSKKLVERIGFIKEATLKHWFGEKDAVIYRMLRTECRWLKHDNKNKKELKNG